MLPLRGNVTVSEKGVPKILGVTQGGKNGVFPGKQKGFKLQGSNSRGLSPPRSKDVQGIEGSVDSKVATKVVAPPILKGGGEKEPRDSPLGGTGTLGSPPIKNPPGTMNQEEKGGDQNPRFIQTQG